MNRSSKRYLTASALFATVIAATVICAAGYYVSPTLLVGQMLGIGLPTFAPLAVLGLARVRNIWITLVIAAVVVIGWGRVIYIDTRPYQGGGASFAILLGWAMCALAFTLAVFLAALGQARRAMRSRE